MNEWKTLKLGDVCKIKYGKDHKKLRDGDIPVYGSGGIIRYVNTEIYNHESVLIPRKGTLSNLFFVKPPFWTVDTLFWTDIFTDKIKPQYLFYYLKTKNLQSYNVGTAVPSLTTAVLNEIDLPIPPLPEQKAIASVLSALDDKIELNNKINKSLEEMAQAIFKSWFVDFEPFQDGEFVESKLGMIPKGWKVGTLGEIVTISNKTFNPSKQPEILLEHYSIPAFDKNKLPVFEQAVNVKSNKFIVTKENFLISKLNPTIKRIWRPYCTTINSVCSTEFIVYKPILNEQKDYCYGVLDSKGFYNYITTHITGSTGSRQRAKPKETLDFKFPIPEKKVINNFSKLVKSIFNLIERNYLENTYLSQLRDTLLPKLMNGEIRVPTKVE